MDVNKDAANNIGLQGLSINSLHLFQYKNYQDSTVKFDHSITCITGKNGIGKTNILDAIYYLCYTKSYFTNTQLQIIQHGMDAFRVAGSFKKGDQAYQVSCKWKNNKKEVSLNNVLYEQLAEHIGKFAAVIIAPDDIALIIEGSEVRRKWMDGILSQSDASYLTNLMKYQRVLLQRNAWLKMRLPNDVSVTDELLYYDAILAETGDFIHHKRAAFTQSLQPMVQHYYSTIAQDNEEFEVVYKSDVENSNMRQCLQSSLGNDFRFQRTVRGIHRDDWQFLIDRQPMKQFASQGQKKSGLLVLKLAQYHYLTQNLKYKPILLLDDIFEKLDQFRLSALMQLIDNHSIGQVIITDTHEDRVKATFGAQKEIGLIHLPLS